MNVNKRDLHSLLEHLKEINEEEKKIKTKISVQKDEILKTENMINQFHDCHSQQNERLLQLCTDHENVKCRKNQIIQAIKQIDKNDENGYAQEDIELESPINNKLIVPNEKSQLNQPSITNDKDLKRNIAENEMNVSHENETSEKKRRVDYSINEENDEDNNKFSENGSKCTTVRKIPNGRGDQTTATSRCSLLQRMEETPTEDAKRQLQVIMELQQQAVVNRKLIEAANEIIRQRDTEIIHLRMKDRILTELVQRGEPLPPDQEQILTRTGPQESELVTPTLTATSEVIPRPKRNRQKPRPNKRERNRINKLKAARLVGHMLQANSL